MASLAPEGLEVITPVIAGNKNEAKVQTVGLVASLLGGGIGSLVAGKPAAAAGAVTGSLFGPPGSLLGGGAGSILGGTVGYVFGFQAFEA